MTPFCRGDACVAPTTSKPENLRATDHQCPDSRPTATGYGTGVVCRRVKKRSIRRRPLGFDVLIDADSDHAPPVLSQPLGAAYDNRRACLGVCQQRLIGCQVLFDARPCHGVAKFPRLGQAAGDDQASLITRHLGWRALPLRIGDGVKAGEPLRVLFSYRRSFPLGGHGRLRPTGAARPTSGQRGEAYQPPGVSAWSHGCCVPFVA